ncbi:hypothetical protein N7474_005336 [Penicillium riverlandense]|uniref:uncharacterized protein n=1 Tax=Penicillium riverlandense TaxID=1903569 RepID=UPI002548A5AB|nr:uncharacterized protein N7474_005336 [Penicillium riverlandense]KAJ5819745.1 hypothetical protein N7474_005336 [Penicillium riverlandense]
MATPSVVSISPPNTGVFHVPLSQSSIATVNQFLQENHDRYHPFFNEKGFHNHITHYLLAALSLGATPVQLTRAFEQEKALQRAQFPLNEKNMQKLADTDFFRSCMGQEQYYRDFLIFFQKEIKEKGAGAVVNEYVFSHKENAELMFTRLFASTSGNPSMQYHVLSRKLTLIAGFLHPLIHLGYGIEFNQPAIIAEGLAQSAVHKNEVSVAMLGAEAAASSLPGEPSPSLIDLLNQVRSNKSVRDASCWGDGSWIEDVPLTQAPEELWRIAAQWRVQPNELKAKTAEMINVNGFMCGAAQMPPKEYKLDFFLIHNLNCSIFFASFLKQGWMSTESKIRLLEWKGRFDVISYAARGSPQLAVNEIKNYVPKRPSTGWDDLYQRVNDMDDDSHVTKFLRGMAHGEQFCEQFGAAQEERFPLSGDMWRRIGHMAVDTTEKEPVARNRWVRGAGFPSQWTHFHNRL